jgi:hypothetical protein
MAVETSALNSVLNEFAIHSIYIQYKKSKYIYSTVMLNILDHNTIYVVPNLYIIHKQRNWTYISTATSMEFHIVITKQMLTIDNKLVL